MVTTSRVSTNEWLEKARSLGPLVRQYADESEQSRRMALELFKALQASGIFDMMCPSAFGGPQASLEEQVRVIEEFARHDGAAGWNVMIWAAQGVFADYMPEHVAAEVVGAGKGNLVAGAVNPTGQAVPVEGGYRVSGRWSFASGCEYATWLIAGCIVIENGGPRFIAPGVPDIQVCILPQAKCQIIDTWHTAGLRGTGSQDFAIDDFFVAADHAIALGDFIAGPTPRPSTAHRTPFQDFGFTIASVSLGIARDALDTFKELAMGKTPAIGTMTLAQQPVVQQRFGQAEATLRAARSYLFETLREISSAHDSGIPVTDDDRAALRIAASYVAQSAVDATDIVFELAGGTSVYNTNRLERCWRNVHMTTHHMFAAPGNIEMAGRTSWAGH